MPKNFKKLFVCIVATFCITAMVFSCCKKVGLCASSENNPIVSDGSFPLLFGNDIGSNGVNLNIIPSILDAAITDNNRYNSGDPVIVYYVAWRDMFYVCFPSPNQQGNFDVVNSSGSMSYDTTISFWCYYNYMFDSSGNGQGNGWDWQYSFNTSNIFDNINNEYVYIQGTQIDNYVLYVYNPDNLFLEGTSTQVFSDSLVPSGPQGHSKGGVLSNYIDSDDLIENSSDLPKVDTSAPSNSSSVPDWLQKILNGIGKLNQSIQGGVLTIGDYLGSMIEKIGEWFQDFKDSIGGFFDRVQDSLDDIIDTIEGLKDGSTVSQAQGAWEQDFNNSIFKDFVDIKSTIETDILTPIRNANAPSSLSFTIPLITVNVPNLVNNGGSVSTSTNNVYLFGRSVTLDFSWYTRSISGGVFNGSSIRDYLVPIIATFLYVGMVVHLLFKIPSFLNGSSGFSNTLHSVVVSNNGSKLKKA